MIDTAKYVQKRLKKYSNALRGLERNLSYPKTTAAKKIRRNLFENSFKIDDMLTECGIHRHNFFAHFKHYTGKTPKQFILYHRTEAAKQFLDDEKLQHITMGDLSYFLGFSTPPGFTRSFKRHTGMTPTEWKECKKENK